MANITVAISESLVVPKTTGSGVTYNELAPTYAESMTMSDDSGAKSYTVAAGATGVNIFPPTFSAFDHIKITAKPQSSNADANKFQFVVKRTDTGSTVVHESYSNGLPVSFALESGDVALTIDNLDGSNSQVFTVVHTRRVIS